MIDLYYWPTPNGWKISIMLEECALPYRVVPVNIGQGDQFEPAFLAISPNNRMPAIVDHDVDGEAVPVFESGAILVYLAEKSGRFLPQDDRGRKTVMEWLFWQVGNLGPMAGQVSHFTNYAPADHDNTYARERYANEYNRCLGVLDRRLAEHEYLCGAYSIADMACWPWVVPYKMFGESLEAFPHLRRWHGLMKARPAASRGLDVMKDARRKAPPGEAERRVLFGQTAATLSARSEGAR